MKNENHVQSLQQKFDKSIDDCLKNNLTTEDAVSKVIKELLTEVWHNYIFSYIFLFTSVYLILCNPMTTVIIEIF